MCEHSLVTDTKKHETETIFVKRTTDKDVVMSVRVYNGMYI